MKNLYLAYFYYNRDSDTFSVEFPNIKHCNTSGNSYIEAFQNAENILKSYIEKFGTVNQDYMTIVNNWNALRESEDESPCLVQIIA